MWWKESLNEINLSDVYTEKRAYALTDLNSRDWNIDYSEYSNTSNLKKRHQTSELVLEIWIQQQQAVGAYHGLSKATSWCSTENGWYLTGGIIRYIRNMVCFQ